MMIQEKCTKLQFLVEHTFSCAQYMDRNLSFVKNENKKKQQQSID